MTPINLIFSYLVFPGAAFEVFFGLLLEGIDRKIGAHIQSRIGPPIWQPFIDMVKLFGKEDITPSRSQRWLFNFAPYLSFGAILAVIVMLPIASASPSFSTTADLIVIIYLLNLPPIALMLGGAASSTPFGMVGTSRYLVQLFAYEFPFIVAALTVAGQVGWSLSLEEIVIWQQANGWLVQQLPLAFLAAILVAPGKLLKVPFDIPEADSEIVMGPLAEYSGPKLAIFHISHNIEILAVAGFIAALFLGGPQSFSIGGLEIPGIVSFLVKVVAILLLITFIRCANARLSIHKALKFYWTFVAGIALLNLIWVVVM